jgi:pSer/pThr/pTyr-binding forkhead associated (FHA) protein
VAAKYSRLIGKAGTCKGKRIQLKQDAMTLGSARGTAIRLKGDYVSEEHAVIRKRVDDRWMIENKSEFGLLVNAERVEARVLSHGDTIQVGSANLLEFEDLQQLQQAEKKPASSSVMTSAAFKNPKQLGIFAAILVYLGFMAFLLSDRLGDEDSGGEMLDARTFTAAIDATIDYVNSGQVVLADSEGGLDRSAPNYLFYELVTMSQDLDQSEADRERRADELRQQLQAMFLEAYQYQQMQQYRRATRILNEVYLMIPDPRAPITRYSLMVLPTLQQGAVSE